MNPRIQPLRIAAIFLPLFLAAAAIAAGPAAFKEARRRMVDEEIVAAGVKDARVIQAMRDTPRHEFVPLKDRPNAYYDMALPIGHGQTISPPFVVAYMTESLAPKATDRVLEIGTGSGYQAAVLSPLVRDVYTIEIVEPLARKATKLLKRLHYDNVHVRAGDGYQGWPEHAPFDKIIVTCSPENIPKALVDQLAEGGSMIIPVGERYQQTLFRLTKRDGKLQREKLLPTLFVPMTGAAEDERRVQPDPLNPRIVNGDFEEFIEPSSSAEPSGDTPPPRQPEAWHYQRQLDVVESAESPSGKHYARFRNDEPGRASRALQGFAVDGRKVRRLAVSLSIAGKDIRSGQDAAELPLLAIVFYGPNREILGQRYTGPWRGTFAWQTESVTFDVPVRAREAILRIGLFGATGEFWVDNLVVMPAK